MITVRFATGFSVQYNEAAAVSLPDSHGISRLYRSIEDRDANRRVIARVPKEALVEYCQACQTYQAGERDAWEAVRRLEREVAGLKRKIKKVGVLG